MLSSSRLLLQRDQFSRNVQEILGKCGQSIIVLRCYIVLISFLLNLQAGASPNNHKEVVRFMGNFVYSVNKYISS